MEREVQQPPFVRLRELTMTTTVEITPEQLAEFNKQERILSLMWQKINSEQYVAHIKAGRSRRTFRFVPTEEYKIQRELMESI